MHDYAPIVLVTYRRPEHTRRVLEALSRNEEAKQSKLYVFCDGPRGDDDLEAVAKTREVVRSRRWCGEVEIVEREENLGLSRSMIGSISSVLDQHDRGIVLEDDMLVTAHFLDYMNRALVHFQDEPRVMQISGFTPPIDATGLPETFLLRYGSIWAFALWRRAWQRLVTDADELMRRIRARGLVHYFNLDGARSATTVMSLHQRGKIDSWAVRWYASIIVNDGLCLSARQTLVENIGVDGSGRHTGVTADFNVELGDFVPHRFQDAIEEHPEALERIKRFHRERGRRLAGQWWRQRRGAGTIG